MLNDRLKRAIQQLVSPSPDAMIAGRAHAVFIDEVSRLPLKKAAHFERLLARAIWYATDIRKPDSDKLKRARETPWLYIVHGDGFRREAALDALTGPAPNAFLLTLVFRRLNDWVPEVRRAARDAVSRIGEATQPNVISTALLGTFAVSGSWRRLGSEDVRRLHELLQRPDVGAAVADRLKAMTSGPGSRMLRQSVRTAAMDHMLESIATGAVQPALRATAWSMLFDRAARWQTGWQWKWIDKSLGERTREPVYASRPLSLRVDLLRAMEQAIDDRSFAVRKAVGDALIAHRRDLGEAARRFAEALAASKNKAVAERGRFVLNELDG